MPNGPSALSLVAASLYGVVILCCGMAFWEARNAKQIKLHRKVWVAIAILFGLLIVSRLFLIEDILRADLREFLRSEGMFAGRRAMQGPVIAVAIALGTAIALIGTYFAMRRVSGRRNIAVAVAAAGSGIMLAIIAMRIISLHAMDFLLYGPPKLNWVGDLGASCMVMAAATYYILLLRGRIGRRTR